MSNEPMKQEFVVSYAAAAALAALALTVVVYAAVWALNHVPVYWVAVYVVLFVVCTVSLRWLTAYELVPK